MSKLQLIFTEADKRIAKKAIPNFRNSYFIDLSEYILEVEYVRSGHVSNAKEYIANSEIIKKLKQSVENKRSSQIVYFHFDINETTVQNVRAFYEAFNIDIHISIFDPMSRLCEMYNIFDKVLTIGE